MKKYICILLVTTLLFLSACGTGGGNAKKISSLDDLKNMKIGLVTGTQSVPYAEENYPDAKLMQFNGIVDAIAALKSKKTDCVIIDLVAIEPIVKQDDTLARYPETLTQDDYSLVVKKGNSELLDKLNTFIELIHADGTFAELRKRWVDDENYEQPEILSSGENGKIKVGIGNNIPLPVAGMVDGKIVGTAPEMAYRFAQHYGYELEIVYIEFGALIAALESGKIDFISCDMMVTPERAQRVDFSVPYDVGGQAIVMLKDRLG